MESNVACYNVALSPHESIGSNVGTHDVRVAAEEVLLHRACWYCGCSNGCMFNACIMGSILTAVSKISDFFF